MEDYTYLEYLKAVGQKEARQFTRAMKNPMNRFEDELQGCLWDGVGYIPLSDDAERPGRNHLPTVKVAEGQMALQDNAYFANRLIKADAIWETGMAPYYPPPSSRVALGGLHIYTFEFDVKELEFFRTQLSWIRWGKKPIDCPMGRLYRTCSRWTDFRGITVCWSGHKSLHIHIVFDAAPYIERFGLPVTDPRAGLIAQWNLLEPHVIDDLGLAETAHRPDPQIKYPEQYRRLPNGHRLTDDGHLLGIPSGTLVQQTTLWELWRDRAAQNATGLFHLPTSFAARPDTIGRNPTRQSPGPQTGGQYTDTEIAYCEDRLRETYPDTDWPRLAHLTFESGCWKASFFNSARDRHPASIMKQDYQNIRFMGRDAEGLKSVPLEAPLGEMMQRWALEFHSPDNEEVLLDGPQHVGTSSIERAYSLATSFDQARDVLDQHLPRAVLRSPLLLVHAAEGATKTSVLLRHHPRIAKHLAVADESPTQSPRRAMYAFGNYGEAENKCQAFNEMHEGSDFIGIVLESFSRRYAAACIELGKTVITKVRAARLGFPSVWAAVVKQQPTVAAWLYDRHRELWEMIGHRQPVFFTVHQVAHWWQASSQTRLMSAPSYWTADEKDRTAICRDETRLSLVVHDEVQKGTFVEAVSHDEKVWIDGLMQSGDRAWSDCTLRQRERAFRQFRSQKPTHGMDFHRATSLANLDFGKPVIVRDTGEYATGFGDHDIYAARHGRQWWMTPRRWWAEIGAQRVVFLTTEEVPVAVAHTADPSIVILSLDAPGLPQNIVDVQASRSITCERLEEQVGKWRDQNGQDWFPISNKLGGAEGTLNHARAKGSNELIGTKIVQTMTMLASGEYEELQALNAWCGRGDLVLLRHIDEFNQTAGRNLGFRHRPGAEHVLLVNSNLFKLLTPKLGHSRYDLRLHVTAEKRREFKRRDARSRTDGPDVEVAPMVTPVVLPFPDTGYRGVRPAQIRIGCAATGLVTPINRRIVNG